MAVEFIVEARSKDNNDRAPWFIVGRENDRIYLLMDGDEPATYDDRSEAEERLDRIRAGEPDPEPPSSDCFLTSACAVVLQDSFRDDGIELETLRLHRDRLAGSRGDLAEDVAAYYDVAPTIVSRINESPNSLEEYEWIFDSMVIPTNEALERGDDESAVHVYREGFNHLRWKYSV